MCVGGVLKTGSPAGGLPSLIRSQSGLAEIANPVRVIRHAALPHAVRGDGVVAHLCKWVPRPVRVYASCACRGCRGDQPACRHHASQCCHDVSLYGSLLPRRVFGSVADVRRRVIAGGTQGCRSGHIAAVVEPAVVGRGARQSVIRRVEYHATLPGAVRLDGSVAPAGGIHPPYRQPALAGGAEPTSPPVISAAARPAIRYCFMALAFTSPLATTLLVRWLGLLRLKEVC
jgi:hypothetical protein